MDKRLLIIWGALDVAFFLYYVIGNLALGKIPILDDLAISQQTAESFGTTTPILLASLSLAVMVSLLLSAYLLIRSLPLSRWVVYAQLPFRATLLMPSIFFIPWLFPAEKSFESILALYILVLAIELIKAYTVTKSLNNITNHSRAPAESAGLDAAHKTRSAS